MLRLHLSARGNPDFGQAPDHFQRLGTVDGVVEVDSLEEASAFAREWIEFHGLGGGNWTGGLVTCPNGGPVARVSYNGRVWPPGEWFPGMSPLI
jgi:hypothetical protein